MRATWSRGYSSACRALRWTDMRDKSKNEHSCLNLNSFGLSSLVCCAHSNSSARRELRFSFVWPAGNLFFKQPLDVAVSALKRPQAVFWCHNHDTKDVTHAQCKVLSVSNLELVLLPGVALAPDILLQVHVVFERLSGGREGNRGQKLNHQTTKHTHGGWERKGEGREGGEENRVSAFSIIPRGRKTSHRRTPPLPPHPPKKPFVQDFF